MVFGQMEKGERVLRMMESAWEGMGRAKGTMRAVGLLLARHQCRIRRIDVGRCAGSDGLVVAHRAMRLWVELPAVCTGRIGAESVWMGTCLMCGPP